jgi:hypothetical protein
MRVHHVGDRLATSAQARRHLQIHAEGGQRRIGLGQPRRRAVGVHVRLVAVGAEAVDFDLDQLAQFARKELDVDSSSAVDLRRVLPADQCCAHTERLAVYNRCVTAVTIGLG